MTIREFQESDRESVEGIFALYWTDPEFLEELSGELKLYTENLPKEDCKFFVAEEDNEILGIAGFKKLDDYLKSYAKTNNPIELYVVAVKHKRKGVGGKLVSKLIKEVRELGFSEILFFSPTSHNESWDFHDKAGFEGAGEVTPPDDEIGQIWRRVL